MRSVAAFLAAYLVDVRPLSSRPSAIRHLSLVSLCGVCWLSALAALSRLHRLRCAQRNRSPALTNASDSRHGS